jgi:protein-tyrosine phosphatase/membrane-associated phospholipid phosphatase
VSGAATSRPWRRAAAWLAFLGPFFFASYGFATWFTAQRADVGAVVFGWEERIPFLAWTILPYWSIDVLYAVSLFLCTTRRELDAHARRLLTAQAVAVACFLAFPLRFTFERPDTGGLFGVLFDVLGSFDKPFNQAPSLHIALLLILWTRFHAHVPRAWRPLLHGWFALIGVSVLTTWQHHFIDVPTGALLGAFCLWLWPVDGRSPLAAWSRTHDAVRRRLALRYALGSGLAAAVALAAGGAALWLLWVAVALALVAVIYAALGPAGFQKHDGRLSAGATLLLAPYLAGAWINARLWTRRHPQPDRVADDVWLGRLPTPAALRRHAIAAVVDLCAELPVDPAGRPYAAVPVLDLVAPGPEALREAVRAIDDARQHGRVLVCCALGYSRSAMAVAAWLVASGRAHDADEAMRIVRAARPQIVFADEHRQGLAGIVPLGAAR